LRRRGPGRVLALVLVVKFLKMEMLLLLLLLLRHIRRDMQLGDEG
jgi:hypothetical protein